MSVYPAQPDSSAYERASTAFGNLVVTLGSVANRCSHHAVVERLIAAEGTEVLRLLFEAWFATRAVSEPVRGVVGSDGSLRTHHRIATRQVESLFGTVEVARDRAGYPGLSALEPVDAVLNLAGDRFTFGVRGRVATEAVRGSFDAAVSAVSATTGAVVVKRQAEELVLAAATDFDAFHEETRRAEATQTATDDLLVLTTDGKGIVMRPDALRPATPRAAENDAPKLTTRLSKGEKRNRKRMAVVAAVCDLTPVPRTTANVLGELDRTAAYSRPRARQKRTWASVEKSPGIVIQEMFDEAERRDPRHARRWVALVDGNATQIREIRAAAEKADVGVTLVLDLIHVTEYLWDAAWEVFAEGDPAAERWVKKYLHQVLQGRASTVAAALRRVATCRKLERRTSIDAAARYLLGHLPMLRYHEFLRDGPPLDVTTLLCRQSGPAQ